MNDRQTVAKRWYACAFVALPILLTIASFVRDRDLIFANTSLWLFAVSFLITSISASAGLIAIVFLLTVAPALHLQLNALFQLDLHAFSYAGVDCCLGFLAAWICKARFALPREIIQRSTTTWLLLLHAWIAVSASVAVSRNIWQNASELTARGFLYNLYLLRQLSWHDDYFPLHDLFAYSVAIAMVLVVWALLRTEDIKKTFDRMLIALFVGFGVNAGFAVWQKLSHAGWIGDVTGDSVNAFWPDLHSLGALMALSLTLGYGYFRTRQSGMVQKLFVAAVMMFSAIALYLTGSRSTIFLVCAVFALAGIVFVIKGDRRQRVFALILITALIFGMDWSLSHGYRGLSYDSLQALAKHGLTFESTDKLFSQRPSIWQAALQMYSVFPWFGLGQGAFYRLSAIGEFSSNNYLAGAGGENAHNYLLQTAVELGPIGLILIVLCFMPVLRQGKRNFDLISFYALAGIVIGNLFAHALLVREMLMLGAVFLGVYYWQVEKRNGLAAVQVGRTRLGAIGLGVGLLILAIVEVAQSFYRFPLSYGQRCFSPRAMAEDRWTSGLLRLSIPDSAREVHLTISADRPDLQRRALTIGIDVIDAGGSVLWSRALDASETAALLTIGLPERSYGPRRLVVRASHCYVPLNLGVTYDRRALGVRIDDLRFNSDQ